MLKPFRPFIIGIALFLAFNTAVNLLVAWTPLGEKMDLLVGNKLSSKMHRLASHAGFQPQVLALGTSVTHHAFSPDIFEQAAPYKITSFNMGIPGSNPNVQKTYLDYHLHHYGKPKLLLLEVTDTILSNDNFYMPATEYISLFNQNPAYWTMLLNNPLMGFEERKEVILSWLFAVYHYRSIFSPVLLSNKAIKEWQERTSAQSSEPLSETLQANHPVTYGIIDAKGWNPIASPPAMQTAKGEQAEALKTKQRHLDKIQKVKMESLFALLDYCKANHLNVVLVEWPRLPQYMALFKHSPIYEGYKKQLNDIQQKYHYPLIDLTSEDTGNARILYENTYHLEGRSAMVYTQLLADRLFAPKGAPLVSLQLNPTLSSQATFRGKSIDRKSNPTSHTRIE